MVHTHLVPCQVISFKDHPQSYGPMPLFLGRPWVTQSYMRYYRALPQTSRAVQW